MLSAACVLMHTQPHDMHFKAKPQRWAWKSNNPVASRAYLTHISTANRTWRLRPACNNHSAEE